MVRSGDAGLVMVVDDFRDTGRRRRNGRCSCVWYRGGVCIVLSV